MFILFLVVMDKRFYNFKVVFIFIFGVVDFFVGVVFVGILIMKVNEKIYDYCFIWIGFIILICVVFIFSLMCIVLEWFIVIIYFLNYKLFVFRNRVVVIIVVVWIVLMGIGFLFLFGWRNDSYY